MVALPPPVGMLRLCTPNMVLPLITPKITPKSLRIPFWGCFICCILIGMNELMHLSQGEIRLIVIPTSLYSHVFTGVASLARTASILVLDCGGVYDPIAVARAAGGRKDVCDHVLAQRAFNCFDVAKLIEGERLGFKHILILDLLTYFCDEKISSSKRNYIAYNAVRQVERMSKRAGVAITVQEPLDISATIARRFFRDLRDLASQTFVFEHLPQTGYQLGFPWER
jgi:hypothetical protein